jgi:hypothetical protein
MDGIECGSIFFVKRALIPCRIANGCKHSKQHGAICDERRIIALGTRDCTRRVKCKPAHFHAQAQPDANAFFIVDEWRKRTHPPNDDGVLFFHHLLSLVNVYRLHDGCLIFLYPFACD